VPLLATDGRPGFGYARAIPSAQLAAAAALTTSSGFDRVLSVAKIMNAPG
jgi:hypothetical protein